MFCYHVCKYKIGQWSPCHLPPPHFIFSVKPCIPHSSVRPQILSALLFYLLSLHYTCNPLNTPLTSVFSSFKLLSFCPFPPKSMLALCPHLSFYVPLERIKTVWTVTDWWGSTSDGFFSVAHECIYQVTFCVPSVAVRNSPHPRL